MAATLNRERRPPKEDLRRTAAFALRTGDDADSDDGLTLDGYAAVFDSVTVINSWEGRFKERVMPGSMKKSFRERTPRLQFDHGFHPLIGSIPIGSVQEVSEDDRGAHVVARLHDNWLIEPVRDAIASESIDGMSFRFTVVREEWRDPDGKLIRDEEELKRLLWASYGDDVTEDELLERGLKELKVPELGPVVWPAYEATSVGVRSKVTIDLGRLTDPGQRRNLARAVILADIAERSTGSARTENAPHIVNGHPFEVPSPSNGTPLSTDVESAGEHESVPPRGMRPVDLWVRKARDTVLTIDTKERRSR